MKRTLFLLPILIAAAAPARADAPRLYAGSAAAEITPDAKLVNWVDKKPYGAVRDPLFVRALAISDGRVRVLLLTYDLVETREAAVAEIRAAVGKELGVPADRIMLNASHSHSSPFLSTGDEPLVPVERALIAPQTDTDAHRAWSKELIRKSVEAARRAEEASRPATLGIAHAWAGEVLFNRRPIRPDGKVETTLAPADPYALPEGRRFGPVDPTLTWLSFRDLSGKPIAAVWSLPAHAVSIYGEFKGLSADWPGEVGKRIKADFGAEAMFVQGCSGDVVPWRRGSASAARMGELVAERARAAEANRHPLPDFSLTAARVAVNLPYHERWKGKIPVAAKRSEVQVFAYGPLAIVALPGEPLTALGAAIRDRSPFPHTIVLGYSNGSGVQYVGAPGEKAKGGYEMGEWGLGSDECGKILIDAAVGLLERLDRGRGK